MKVAVFGNNSKERSGAVADTLVEVLHSHSLQFIVEEDLLPLMKFQFGNIPSGSREFCAGECDVIVSIGGDGTLLRSAVTAHAYNKPIAGINLGKLGFLAEVSVDDIEHFCLALKNNELHSEERLVLQIKQAENIGIAFNDFVIDKGGWPRMIELRLSVDGLFVTSVYADGLIISTPAGSTGYSLSAGGSVIAPWADVIALSAIAPHTMTMRPMIIPGSGVIEVTAVSLKGKTNLITDGHITRESETPATFTIAKHERPLSLLRFPGEIYFETLRKKLLLGMDSRTSNQ